MTIWDFTADSTSVIKTLRDADPPREQTFDALSLRMVDGIIYLYEAGEYATAVKFEQIGEIDGVEPTDLQDAYDKILAIIPAGGGGGSQDIQSVLDISPRTFTKTEGDYTYTFDVFESGAFYVSVVNNVTGSSSDFSLSENTLSSIVSDGAGNSSTIDSVADDDFGVTETNSFGSNVFGVTKRTSVTGDANIETPTDLPTGSYIVAMITQAITSGELNLSPSSDAVKTYVDNKVAGVLNLRGNYDASGNVFPSTGGSGTAGAILKGDFWYISVAGTLNGQAVQVGDSIYAQVDTPSSSQWEFMQANLTYVPENVANKENTTLDTSTTKYPTNNLVKTTVDLKAPLASPAITGAPTISGTLVITGTASSGVSIVETAIGGTGSANGGIKLGSFTTDVGGIWSNAVTPSTSNYMIIGSSTVTDLNAVTTLRFNASGNIIASINSAGMTMNTAKSLTVAGGTTTVVPFKMTSGTNLTTPQNGGFEYNGTNLFFTRAGAVREGVITESAVTTEVVVSDTTVTVNIGGVTYKLLARA